VPSEKLDQFVAGVSNLPETYLAWQMFGAGFENFGRDKKPLRLPLRPPADNELLARVDAVSLCFSDVKLIKQGNAHPRVRGRDLANDPTVPGHECAVTIAAVGSDWADSFEVGQRFIVQAEIYYKGVNVAFGYAIPGGLAQYTYLDERVLAGDDGCYLLPLKPATGFSEAALTEPWACVEMAYNIEDRFHPLDDGTMLIVDFTGDDGASCVNALENAFTERPAETTVWTSAATDAAGSVFDDIIVFGVPEGAWLDALPPLLNKGGTLVLVSDGIREGELTVDVGRVHYEKVRVTGSDDMDVAAAYRTAQRMELVSGGKALFAGAGGPMGQMHVQRAIEMDQGPARITATEVDESRLEHVYNRFSGLAESRGVDLQMCNPVTQPESLGPVSPGEFDDVVILAPVVPAIEDGVRRAKPGSVVNIFAGVATGTQARIDLAQLLRGVRMVGSSGSRIADMRKVLDLAESGQLSTNFAAAAVSGMAGVYEGLEAVRDAALPGKVVVYPFVEDMGVVPFEKLGECVPAAAANLGPHGEWTTASERAFLENRLP
jgi:threonine dehydrogenase-like Zn-dependent dehydrogenase